MGVPLEALFRYRSTMRCAEISGSFSQAEAIIRNKKWLHVAPCPPNKNKSGGKCTNKLRSECKTPLQKKVEARPGRRIRILAIATAAPYCF